MDKPELVHIKAENRRITMIYLPDKDAVVIRTKRLVSREKRQITETHNIYSTESFYLMKMAMDLIDRAPELTQALNRAEGRLYRQKTMEVTIGFEGFEEEDDQ